MTELENKLAESRRMRRKAGFMLTIAAFAVLVAYLHRMTPTFTVAELPAAEWHKALMLLLERGLSSVKLFAWALPTVLAGVVIVWCVWFVAAKKSVYWGLFSGVWMLGCYGFLTQVRQCSTDILYLAAAMIVITALSFSPAKQHKSALLLWLPVWAICGWEKLGDFSHIMSGWWFYSALLPLSILAALAVIKAEVFSKKPHWRSLLFGATVLLLMAPERVMLFSLPLAAWTLGYFFSNPYGQIKLYKPRRILSRILSVAPAGGMVLIGLTFLECRNSMPGYQMPLVMPLMLLAVMQIGVYAARSLKFNYRQTAIIGVAALTVAVLTIMVWEPYKQYQFFVKNPPNSATVDVK